jgi:hypothetical protein
LLGAFVGSQQPWGDLEAKARHNLTSAHTVRYGGGLHVDITESAGRQIRVLDVVLSCSIRPGTGIRDKQTVENAVEFGPGAGD